MLANYNSQVRTLGCENIMFSATNVYTHPPHEALTTETLET